MQPLEAALENIIGTLLNQYETGALTRRDLVQRLLMLAAGAAAPAGAHAQTPGFQIVDIDHVQVNSSNVRRSTEFYQKVLGLSVLRLGPPDKPNCCPDESAFLGAGGELLVAIRKKEPAGQIDHFGFRVANYNQDVVTDVLKQRGVTPKAGYVIDPDGARIQLSS
jgi:catechol 2,3-dioxygenase-like lactoylglutathione lyase family enzyme